MATSNDDSLSVMGYGTQANPNSISGPVQQPQQVFSADGTIVVYNGNFSVVITKTGTAAALTLPAPIAGGPGIGQDGIEVVIDSETNLAHVITCPVGFNRKGSSGTATFTASVNDWVRLVARNGQWNVIGFLNCSFA